MQIEAGVRGVVGDCKQMSAKNKARIAPCLDFGLVGQLSVTSPLRLAGCTSSHREESAPRRCGAPCSPDTMIH